MLCIHFNAADRVDVHVRDGSWENNVLKFDDGVERIPSAARSSFRRPRRMSAGSTVN